MPIDINIIIRTNFKLSNKSFHDKFGRNSTLFSIWSWSPTPTRNKIELREIIITTIIRLYFFSV